MNTPASAWFLKKKNNTLYGPVSIDELSAWARECRIVAGNLISGDKKNWIPVEEIPELEMDWLARRQDGKQFGPFPLSALPALLEHRVLPKDATLTHRHSEENLSMQDALKQIQTEDPAETAPLVENRRQTAPIHETTMEQPENQEPNQPSEEKITLPEQSDIPEEPKPAITGPSQDADVVLLTQEVEILKAQLASMQAREKDLARKRARQKEDAQAEIDAIRAELETALQQTEEQQQHQLQKQQELEIQIEELQKALEEARQETHPPQPQDNTQGTAVEELRQQVAFMKKNMSALNGQLATVRHTAAQRAKMLAVAWITVTCVTAFLIVMFVGRGCRPEKGTAQADARTQQQPATATQQPSEALPPITGQAVAEGRGTGTASTRPTTTPLPGPHDLDIQIEGISVTARTANSMTIRFEAGIFSSLDTLSTQGRTLLDALARQLPRNLTGWQMTIHGHTDNIPMRSTLRFADNSALALARAEAVAQHFIRRASYPTEAITSRPGTTAPFPNDTEENRIRNRTVTIELQR
jgi:flagellar motor protein MotB